MGDIDSWNKSNPSDIETKEVDNKICKKAYSNS